MNDTLFRLEFPLERTHLGMPMGNGNMGVLVWGEGTRVCLTVNRGDYWDHRQGEQVLPGQSYRELVEAFDPFDVEPVNARFVREERTLDKPGLWWPSSRLPVGRIELELSAAVEYVELDYASGCVCVKVGDACLRMVLSRHSQQLLIEDKNGLIAGVVPRPAWEWVGDILGQVGFEAPELWEDADGFGWYQGCPADPGMNVICRRQTYGWALGLELGYELQKELEHQDFATVYADNSAYWCAYWDKVPRVSLPDNFLNKFYRLALYKFACATDPAGGVPASLQGPWLEEYQRSPWSCDYHFNVNIQQIYTLGFGIGAWEHILPLFDMLESESFQTVMRSNAKNLFGIDDGLLLTHAVDDRGFQCGGISVGAVLDFACGGWMGKLYWDYYLHTLDKEFLRERAFPFIAGVMRIYEAALEKLEDGSLSLPLSISAEYGCTFPVKKDGKLCRQNSGRDPSNQLMCAHMLSEILIKASAILGLEPKREWLDVREYLPQYILTGEAGNEHIALWEGQDLDVCHRHHSHLAGIYPFETLSEPTPEQARVIDNTIDHWILRGMGQWSEWCYPWAAIIQARLGFTEAPAQLLNLWKELFVNESMSTVYLPRFQGLSVHRRADMLKPKESHEIMQLDGTMAGATAIQEMLVHRKGDTVYVFPGIPEKWQDVSFEHIRLPGALTVSATRNNGRTVSIRIKSLKGGTLKIKLPENISTITVDFEAGEEKDIDGTAD